MSNKILLPGRPPTEWVEFHRHPPHVDWKNGVQREIDRGAENTDRDLTSTYRRLVAQGLAPAGRTVDKWERNEIIARAGQDARAARD